MFRSRIFWRIFSGYAVVTIVMALIVGVQVGRQVEQNSLAQTETRLLESAVLARELAAANPSDLQDTLRRIGAQSAIRYTVIASDGTVRADSEHDAAGMESHAGRPEVVEAAEFGVGRATRRSRTLGVRMMYVAVRSGDDFVRAALPLRVLEERRAATRSSLTLAVGLALLVAAGLGLAATRALSGPLVEMSETARSIAAGNFDRRIALERNDEIGGLARSFNLMAGEIQEKVVGITADRDRLRAILAGMVEGVVAVDRAERIVLFNDVAGRLLGADASGAQGQPIRSVTRAHDVADVLADALRTGVDRTREVVLEVSGAERVLEIHAGPFGGPDSPLGAVLVLHEVTELRRLESVRRDFVSNVSHELKTPLTAVRGMLETMVDDPGMPDDVRRDFLGRMSAQADRLSRIVADLLDLTRIESASGALARERVDFKQIVEETLRILEGAAGERGIALERTLPDSPLWILGDRPSLRLLVDNLVDNAVKYTASQGVVQVALSGDGGWIRLEVRDSGIGIDPQHGDRIFERFYRVDKARSQALGGTGLGLSIVRNVAGEHGGRVAYESVPGSGTVFRVHLPQAPA